MSVNFGLLRWQPVLAIVALLLATTTAQADTGRSFKHTGIEKGKVSFFARYRYEKVNQDGFVNPAKASTILLRPKIITGFVYGFRAAIEGDFIGEIGPDDFNNTINRQTQFPVVVDVEAAELNEAYIESHHIPGVVLTGGRYRKNIDNMRYVGSVGWRQNDQTFDGATALITAIPDTEIFYGYIGNANRIFSDDGPDGRPNDGNLNSNIHLVNAKYKSLPLNLGVITGYAYLFDVHDFVAFSNASYGLHLKGKQKITEGITFNYYAEYARQTDYGTQPVSYDVNYFRVAPGVTFGLPFGQLTTTFLYEELGSDNGVKAFQTPFATGHVFNGFADVFLATPNEGLKDTFFDVTLKVAGLPQQMAFLNGLLLKVQYHDFESDVGGLNFGSEFDLYAKLPLFKSVPKLKGMYAEFKYADYDGEGGRFADREKFIFGLGYKY